MKSPNFYGFHTFAEPGFPVSLNGPFRDNIRQFLQQCAQPQSYNVEGMQVWCTFLVYESRGVVLPLYTVEENVQNSETPFCDYCRCVGWSHHFVSKRKYHFIIPINDEWNKPVDEGFCDLGTHLLHGLIHCNGFGHLICINGIEGGSKYICGREIMDLWDRLCTTLHARKITVEDLSKKHLTDLRLLYGVAYGSSWFSSWGYRFCLGSFGVKEHNYETAIEILSSLKLDHVIKELTLTNGLTHIEQLIQHYRELSQTNVVTVRDLFKFMLSLKSRSTTRPSSTAFPTKTSAFSVPIKRCSLGSTTTRCSIRNKSFVKDKPVKFRKFSNLAAHMDSRWPVRRLEHVAEVIVDALKEKKSANSISNWGMTRQEARDAARLHIGDTGLIDHVLKSMNNVIIGNYIVRRAVNRSTRILEYTIQDLKKGNIPVPIEPLPIVRRTNNVSDDLAYMYVNILLGYDSVNSAVQTILNSKHFVKVWPFRDEDDDSLRFVCRLVKSCSIDLNNEILRVPPREYVVVPLYATISDLKMAIQNAMRDTYCAMEKLIVTDIDEMDEFEDSEVLFGVVESGKEISVRGYGLDLETGLRYEGGSENWTVKCKCGAKDDDGERMLSCDVCETWQHTHCSGIGDDVESVPRFFVCDSCCSSLAPVQNRSEFGFDLDSYQNSMLMPYSMPELDLGLGLMYCK
ncbi:hypothetical protein ACJIZ3_002494 [Penstemon smallii]|uniref:Zinc finger PHD-type domain-containing protein n=1 Tax=Penstemon smallii TaxID=265156 RepID=A0ABD3U6M5_9LAMI